MTRLERRNRSDADLGIKGKGELTDVFDNQIKSVFRINDKEYDFICCNATDTELEDIVNDSPTFAEKRQILSILQKYINQLNSQV